MTKAKNIVAAILIITLVVGLIGGYYFKKHKEYSSIDSAQTEQGDYIVYVSSYKKIHRLSYCSGMEYYKEMYYSEAIAKGYALCENCY